MYDSLYLITYLSDYVLFNTATNRYNQGIIVDMCKGYVSQKNANRWTRLYLQVFREHINLVVSNLITVRAIGTVKLVKGILEDIVNQVSPRLSTVM